MSVKWESDYFSQFFLLRWLDDRTQRGSRRNTHFNDLTCNKIRTCSPPCCSRLHFPETILFDLLPHLQERNVFCNTTQTIQYTQSSLRRKEEESAHHPAQDSVTPTSWQIYKVHSMTERLCPFSLHSWSAGVHLQQKGWSGSRGASAFHRPVSTRHRQLIDPDWGHTTARRDGIKCTTEHTHTQRREWAACVYLTCLRAALTLTSLSSVAAV